MAEKTGLEPAHACTPTSLAGTPLFHLEYFSKYIVVPYSGTNYLSYAPRAINNSVVNKKYNDIVIISIIVVWTGPEKTAPSIPNLLAKIGNIVPKKLPIIIVIKNEIEATPAIIIIWESGILLSEWVNPPNIAHTIIILIKLVIITVPPIKMETINSLLIALR